jgi:hypothetical protein
VVHACGHHLLNMINMARDMLRGLDGGNLELSASKVQISTPIDEVSGSKHPGEFEGPWAGRQQAVGLPSYIT